MFKIDKGFIALVGLYLAADELKSVVARRKQARIDAVNARFDAEKKELEHRLALLNALKEEEDTSWM